ncbi:hypothetical protein TSH7_01195 [Azospirillum sp. TSH7]|uniref:hypothetical protein n=1 Tax=unclassified Azospirillum TaxID=2630922 RepID=UPI000D61825F|nr:MULTISPECIES: hypothetical protein [unclassified Azospirillum]PWC69090.1 hypothetical protein TSH7_01195 [Azospirillum sp. TSH7]PWC71418.1 hypothetical protein TSH20_03880 [Azospirillum sp. TSH20]
MDIFETVPPFDARTHRQAHTYADTPDPERDRIVRVWGVEPIPPEEIAAGALAQRRGERDAAMPEALNILSRHRNQRDYGLPTTLTDEQSVAWAVYLQGLRDYPETGVWPDKPE